MRRASEAVALRVSVKAEALEVELADGRTITAPVAWFPRLAHGNSDDRGNWRLIGGGTGIHWPDLGEDISVESLLAGRRSGGDPRIVAPMADGAQAGMMT